MKKKYGFTLIELLVVISIISVLVGIGIATFSGVQKKSRDARRQADLQSVRSALELFRTQNPATGYPTTTVYDNLPITSFINPLPIDPINDATYKYSYSGGGSTYSLCVSKWEYLTIEKCQTPP